MLILCRGIMRVLDDLKVSFFRAVVPVLILCRSIMRLLDDLIKLSIFRVVVPDPIHYYAI